MFESTGSRPEAKPAQLKRRAVMFGVVGGIFLIISALGSIRYSLFGTFAFTPVSSGLSGQAALTALLLLAGGGVALCLYGLGLALCARWLGRDPERH